MDDSLFDRALALVHRHRAASVALFERHLEMDGQTAEAILQRMATETTIVRKMQTGLYLYTHGPIGEELTRLNGFAGEVLGAMASGCIDLDRLRAAAVRFGIADADRILTSASPGET